MEKKDSATRLANDLLSNRSAAALGRDGEREIAAAKIPPIDLRKIPKKEWANFVNHDVTLPRAVANYLSAEYTQVHALTEREVHAIEEAVEKFHRVKPPFYIYMSITLQQIGRPWEFEPEAGKYLTGLTLGHE